MYRHSTSRRIHRRSTAGVTLIELMVALALGSFLMLGAITVFMQSRTTFRVSESISRLQENARFVLDALEPDIRMAHYFGLTTRSNRINGRATEFDPVVFAVGGDCGVNWSVDLGEEVGGENDVYGWACAANGDGAQPNADSLVIRRVSEDAIAPAALVNNTLYLQAARAQEGQIFTGTAIPATFLAATSQTFQLVVHGYYVGQNSALDTPAATIPSLRRKVLQNMSVVDEEVLPLVEDFQVQFGIDTDPLEAVNRGSIDRYVNPGDPVLDPMDAAYIPTATILAVRIWIRVRAEQEERGYEDTTNYVYADQDVGPFNDGFRRVVVSKTIYLRNARPPA
jgi:type IV pilus assembly protein PilW